MDLRCNVASLPPPEVAAPVAIAVADGAIAAAATFIATFIASELIGGGGGSERERWGHSPG